MTHLKSLRSISIELLPLLVFTLASEFTDFITATKIFIALTIVSLLIIYIDKKRIAIFPLLAGMIIVIAGVATIRLNNPAYFMFETTFFNLMCALGVFGSLYMRKPILKIIFKDTFSLSDKGWSVLTWRTGFIFIVLAICNEFVRLNFTPSVWISYKLGITVVTGIFGILQFMYIKNKYSY